MFTKILVPLDGSDLAEGVLPYVTQVARGYDAPVQLLSVIDPEDIDLPSSAEMDHGCWSPMRRTELVSSWRRSLPDRPETV